MAEKAELWPLIRTYAEAVADERIVQDAGGKPKRRGRDLEHPEQSEVFRWAAEHAPQHPELELLYAVPNYAGNVSRVVRARAKREGKKKGMLDVVCPVPRKGFGGLYLEMKSEEGTPSTEQRWWIRRLREVGNRVEVANSASIAKLVLVDYLGLPGTILTERPDA